MDGKTHLAAGVVTGVSIVYLENKLGMDISKSSILFVVGCGLGALLPDIDIEYSPMGKCIPVWLFLKHRTVTHSIFFIVIVGLIGLMFGVNAGLNIGFMVGIATHLLLDSSTPMGLPYLLFPFNRIR